VERLRSLARDYFAWRNEQYPVFSSDQGLHKWDARLTDYSIAAVASRREHVNRLLKEVRAMPGTPGTGTIALTGCSSGRIWSGSPSSAG